jgi:acyl-CoA reductase-like NAD-dependent aldehyde dehydrogenase
MISAVAAARTDWQRWRGMALAKRLRCLTALRRTIVAELEDIVAAIGERAGKPALDALLNDVMPTLALIDYYEQHAAQILRPERRPAAALFGRARFHVEYHPRGVVVVLAPFNLPFQLTLGPVVTAFAAGNAVVAKVSERTTGLVPLFTRLFDRAGFPAGAVRFLTGGPEVGETLVRARPDLVVLTGGAATGRRVMALAAENLTPVVLELGGKDPCIVFADAPFERAVHGAVYGAFANAGQVCVAAQRVYVERPLLERFAAAAAAAASALRVWPDDEADIGALVTPEAAARFESLIDDALARGARLRTASRVDGRVAAPVVLTGVNAKMRLLREEAFGPALPIVPFDTEEEAVALANASEFGLSASVWTSDRERGRRVASRLEVGSVAINDVLKHVGNPSTPFGGIKASGIGLARGPEGLRACCRVLSVMENASRVGRELNWFPYTRANRRAVEATIEWLYGDSSWLARIRLLWRLRDLDASPRPEEVKP